MPSSTIPNAVSAVTIRNRLLATFTPEDLACVRPHLEPAVLSLGTVPIETGQPIAHVLFPEAGIVSMLAVSPDKRRRIEAGVIGREGMVGLPVVLGTDAAAVGRAAPGHG